MEISSEVDGRYARIEGELIPLVSNVWLCDSRYTNPFAPLLHDVANPKDREFLVVLLQKRRVVLTDDEAHHDEAGTLCRLTRKDILGLYAIDNAAYAPDAGLSFTLGSMIAPLTTAS